MKPRVHALWNCDHAPVPVQSPTGIALLRAEGLWAGLDTLGAEPNPNALLMAVYGSLVGESNDAVQVHTSHWARMSVLG